MPANSDEEVICLRGKNPSGIDDFVSPPVKTKAQVTEMHERPIILVVDDEHYNRSLMEDFLTPLGYEVILAQDGEQALEKVKELAPDVILLDVMMPKADGFTVARVLKSREETKTIPIVMLTALMDMESRIKAFELGADTKAIFCRI